MPESRSHRLHELGEVGKVAAGAGAGGLLGWVATMASVAGSGTHFKVWTVWSILLVAVSGVALVSGAVLWAVFGGSPDLIKLKQGVAGAITSGEKLKTEFVANHHQYQAWTARISEWHSTTLAWLEREMPGDAVTFSDLADIRTDVPPGALRYDDNMERRKIDRYVDNLHKIDAGLH